MVTLSGVTKRTLIGAAAAVPMAFVLASRPSRAADIPESDTATHGDDVPTQDLSSPDLPAGVRSRMVAGINGLDMHVLEAGFETPGRPAVLLLHGFPDLAYSWRRTIAPLAEAGYHVIAPDQRGYGLTTGWDARYDGDVASFRTHNFARDAIGILMAMGHRSAHAVVGHDFGAAIAAYCALVRPDVFKSLVLMSYPFDGPPALPFDTHGSPRTAQAAPSLSEQLAELPRPRKDSMVYFSSPGANDEMLHCKQGVRDFLRAYFHVKSADWKANKPFPLQSAAATELAKMPTYYIMDLHETMATTVAPDMPSPAEIAATSSRWLPDPELAVYANAFARTGFQGGLNWFRCTTGTIGRAELELFSGRTIDVPSAFISGAADWGIYRKPGAMDRMRTQACSRMEVVDLIDHAGHWVQQEQPERFNGALIGFLQTV